MLDDFGLLLTAATGEFAVERGVDEGEIPKNINLARFFIEMTGFPGEKAGCPVVSLRDPVFNLTTLKVVERPHETLLGVGLSN